MKLYEEPEIDESIEILKQMQELANGAMSTQASACVQSFKLLWYSGQTQKILEKMGTKARDNFIAHANAIAYLLNAGVQLEKHDYTHPVKYKVNDDGTIVLI